MKSLIVYCTSHGTTEKAVQLLEQHLEGEVTSINLNQSKLPSDLTPYDIVIIGGSIHGGMIQKNIKKFMKNHHDELLKKQVGLFLCCMQGGSVAKEQFDHAFPKNLRDRAVAEGLFGGEFLVSKMNFIEKMMVKKVSGVTEEVSKLNVQNVEDFANDINRLN